MKALSVLRYITDHMLLLPLSCMTRLLNTHGAEMHALCMSSATQTSRACWCRCSTIRRGSAGVTVRVFWRVALTLMLAGKDRVFEEGKWVPVPTDQRFKLGKIEAQARDTSIGCQA